MRKVPIAFRFFPFSFFSLSFMSSSTLLSSTTRPPLSENMLVLHLSEGIHTPLLFCFFLFSVFLPIPILPPASLISLFGASLLTDSTFFHHHFTIRFSLSLFLSPTFQSLISPFFGVFCTFLSPVVPFLLTNTTILHLYKLLIFPFFFFLSYSILSSLPAFLSHLLTFSLLVPRSLSTCLSP